MAMDPQYQLAPTSVADGSSGQMRITAERELIVTEAPSSYQNFADTGDAVIKEGPGVLKAIVVNDPGTTVTMDIHDALDAAGSPIMSIPLTAGLYLPFNIAMATGIVIDLSGAANVTVLYK